MSDPAPKTAPDLTPPTKAAAAAKAPKEPKAAKEPKAPKEKKEAKPRGNYGYSVNATIRIVPDKEVKYRGQRADWFAKVKEFDGKKVSEFNEAMKGRTNGKGTVQTPSGWLRFYVLDGSVKLEGGAPAEAAAAA
jgi:hypothetical protein